MVLAQEAPYIWFGVYHEDQELYLHGRVQGRKAVYRVDKLY